MPYSAGEWLRAADFWRQLNAKQKLSFVECTQSPPMDPYGGLWDIHGHLWRRKKRKRTFKVTVLLLRMILNAAVVFAGVSNWENVKFATGLMVMRHNKSAAMSLFKGKTANITAIPNMPMNLLDDEIEMCWMRINSTLGFPETGLFSQQFSKGTWVCLRRSAAGLWILSLMVSLAEKLCLIVGGFFAGVGFMFFVLLNCLSLPQRHPGWFFEFPRMVGTFSTLKLLRYFNIHMAKHLPDIVECNVLARGGSGLTRRAPRSYQVGIYAFCICWGVTAVILGVSAIYVKLTSLFWMIVQDPAAWDGLQILQLLGFINHVTALLDVDWIELERLFLFRYGGPQSHWSPDKLLKKLSYIDLLLLKVVMGKFSRSLQERWKAWMCLAAFTSEDLQELWLSADAERQQAREFIVEEVTTLNNRLDPLYWPPIGSDPRWCREPESSNPDSSSNPLKQAVNEFPDSDLRPAYFLENLQSYRLWLESNSSDALHLYDEAGDMQLGFAQEAIVPRVHQLTESLDKLLSGQHTAQKLELAAKLQHEIEILQKMDTRSNSLKTKAAKQKKTMNDALPPRSLKSPSSVTGVPSLPGPTQSLTTPQETMNSSAPDSVSTGRESLIAPVMASYKSLVQRWQVNNNNHSSRLEMYLVKIAGVPDKESDSFLRATTPTIMSAKSSEGSKIVISKIISKDVRANILEIFLQLKSVNIKTPEELEDAFRALDLIPTLSSAHQVAKHRLETFRELEALAGRLRVRLDEPPDARRDFRVCKTARDMCMRVQKDASLNGFPDEFVYLQSASQALEKRLKATMAGQSVPATIDEDMSVALRVGDRAPRFSFGEQGACIEMCTSLGSSTSSGSHPRLLRAERRPSHLLPAITSSRSV